MPPHQKQSEIIHCKTSKFLFSEIIQDRSFFDYPFVHESEENRSTSDEEEIARFLNIPMTGKPTTSTHQESQHTHEEELLNTSTLQYYITMFSNVSMCLINPDRLITIIKLNLMEK